MKWCAAVLLALTAAAVADPPPAPAAVDRKPASTTYPTDALTPFVAAIVADKAGDLNSATHNYRKSISASAQAPTYYNLANVQHRLEYFPQAIASYRKYLELAPDAPDRAAVEQRIEQIEQRPSIAVIDGFDPGAIVLVDGKLVGPSPALVYPTVGGHVAERIGHTSYFHRRFYTSAAHTDHVSMKFVEAPGNVVLSAAQEIQISGSWEDRGHTFTIPGRFTLPPGRYTTVLRAPGRACEPLSFEVTRGDHLTHVFVSKTPGTERDRCVSIKIHTQKLKVPK